MRKLVKYVRGGLSTALVLTVLAGAWYAWHHFAQQNIDPHQDDAAQVPAEERMVVELTGAQIKAGKIHTATVEAGVAHLAVIVPGRLAYDETQRVSVRLGTAGMLTKINVQPGDSVEAGQVLATMSSPEVGTARADEMQRAAELKLAQRQADWDKARAVGIRRLVVEIRNGRSPAEIREQFTDEQLGVAREKLLSAYSDQLLAQSLISRIETAADSGALPGRTVDERRRKFESSGSTLQGIIEQTLFDAERAAEAAQIAVEDARRRWEIAAGRVSTLLGVSNTLGDDANESQRQLDPKDLSAIEVRAPRTATVEQKLFNQNERVEAGSVLFVLADTTRLWVRADLRESQWTALALKPGQVIGVTSPALPDQPMQATVVMMGREVDPQTNAITLVASVDNESGRLKPGLFVRAQLPLGQTTSQIAIPDAAVATHAGQSFVFVTDDGHIFTRRDVRLGKSQSGSIEVIAGLEIGEHIAVSGVFTLKSELLLETEE